MHDNIESHLVEKRVFKPAPDFSSKARIKSLAQYRRMYRESIRQPAKFWTREAKELVWRAPWKKILEWKPPFAKWFVGAKLNISENCLDRHLAGPRRNKAAIIWEGEPGDKRTLTYQQLHREVCRFANVLKRNNIKKGDRVIIYLPNIPEAAIAMLACARIGAVHSVVFGGFSADSIRDRINDSGAIALVTADGSYRRGGIVPLKKNVDDALRDGTSVRRVIVFRRAANDIHMEEGRDVWWHRELEYVDANCPPAPHDSEHPLYLLYTSGSTGKPKGVIIPHRGLSHYLHDATSYFRTDIRGAIVSSSICFDATITSLLTPLLLGKRVVLLDSSLDAAFAGLKHYLLDDGNAWLFKITPAHLSALSYDCAGHARSDAQHVLVIGGEQLSYAVVDTWQTRWLPEATYINEYGPTETVVGCSVFSIRGRDSVAADSGAVPIGRPIDNVGLYVVNDGQWAPVGVAGELYISGPGLAAGYVNSPQQTEQRFVYLPNVEPDTRFYRTGDRVRLREDGQFEFIERCDEQLKVRGYRIEAGEIEAVLRTVAGIQEAAVLLQETAEHRLLVAYLQPQQPIADSAAFVQRVRSEISRSLVEYMVPAVFELIDTLPLTPNGKVDKKALPTVDPVASLARSYVPPRSELEALLCRLWQAALGREQVGIHDNFMDLGGNSLLFVKLRAEMESRLGRPLDITAFFEYPTIALLSRHLLADGADQVETVTRRAPPRSWNDSPWPSLPWRAAFQAPPIRRSCGVICPAELNLWSSFPTPRCWRTGSAPSCSLTPTSSSRRRSFPGSSCLMPSFSR